MSMLGAHDKFTEREVKLIIKGIPGGSGTSAKCRVRILLFIDSTPEETRNIIGCDARKAFNLFLICQNETLGYISKEP